MIEYIFTLAGVILIIRAVLGPTFADRTLAADSLTGIIILFMVIYSINIRNPMYLDTALLLALISYIGVIAIARLVTKHD